MIKKLLLVFFLFVLILTYMYTLAITNIPDEMVVFEGEELSLKTIFGIDIKNKFREINISDEKTIETIANNTESITKNAGKKTLEVSLFEKFNVKNVNIDVLPKTKIIPVGSVAGLKLYTNGVLVVGMSEIEGSDNKKYKPYENSGIKEGDTITKIDEKRINSTKELMEEVNASKGQNIKVEYIHKDEAKECSISPVQTGSNQYKIGLWVRDSAAGVGTVSFYEPSTKTFAALGHGITDIDTNELINIASGEFVTTRILNITKGQSGEPGKIQGTIENQANIGTIYKNTKFGIYGKVDNLSSLNIDTSKQMEVALREEIKLGKAIILCSLDNQKPQEYEITIEKIHKENNYDNKSMQIRVTDKRLIEKTGGIIQGMSGSPIIQNGKFIGAVTHVMINNPEQGYAVFGDIMLKQSATRDGSFWQ